MGRASDAPDGRPPRPSGLPRPEFGLSANCPDFFCHLQFLGDSFLRPAAQPNICVRAVMLSLYRSARRTRRWGLGKNSAPRFSGGFVPTRPHRVLGALHGALGGGDLVQTRPHGVLGGFVPTRPHRVLGALHGALGGGDLVKTRPQDSRATGTSE